MRTNFHNQNCRFQMCIKNDVYCIEDMRSAFIDLDKNHYRENFIVITCDSFALKITMLLNEATDISKKCEALL